MTQLLVRARRSMFAVLWLALLIACLSVDAAAQRGGVSTSAPIAFGDGHLLYGDLKIGGAGAEETTTFHVVLYAGMNVVQRQPISKDGRFRFMGVPNGEYALVVEYDGREVYRDPFRLAERQKRTFAKTLRWKCGTRPPARRRATPAFIIDLRTIKLCLSAPEPPPRIISWPKPASCLNRSSRTIQKTLLPGQRWLLFCFAKKSILRPTKLINARWKEA